MLMKVLEFALEISVLILIFMYAIRQKGAPFSQRNVIGYVHDSLTTKG